MQSGEGLLAGENKTKKKKKKKPKTQKKKQQKKKKKKKNHTPTTNKGLEMLFTRAGVDRVVHPRLKEMGGRKVWG